MVSQEWHWEQAIKFAAESIKTTLLLNGAAAIALMTFAATRKFSGALHTPLVLFAVGAMLSAFAFLVRISAKWNMETLCGLGLRKQTRIEVGKRGSV
jgi:hypothetical protein